MRAWAWGLVIVLSFVVGAPPVAAQSSFGPAHHVFATVGSATGAINARPAFNRRLLGIINDSANLVYCSVDGTDAAENQGIRLAAAGTTGDRVFFDRHVPFGPVRCMSATNGSRVLIIEGR